jgi:hypothetical protein
MSTFLQLKLNSGNKSLGHNKGQDFSFVMQAVLFKINLCVMKLSAALLPELLQRALTVLSNEI